MPVEARQNIRGSQFLIRGLLSMDRVGSLNEPRNGVLAQWESRGLLILDDRVRFTDASLCLN